MRGTGMRWQQVRNRRFRPQGSTGVEVSMVRIFELAREYGIESSDLIDRVRAIGITADDHLSALDPDTVLKIRNMFNQAPPQSVVEERVTRTVVRRRARRRDAHG